MLFTANGSHYSLRGYLLAIGDAGMAGYQRNIKGATPSTNSGHHGTVWQESTPVKKTTGPAQTRTQSETL